MSAGQGPRTVADVLRSAAPSEPLRLEFWRDDDGAWVVHPVGGPWTSELESDALPIGVGPDPRAALDILLGSPAGPMDRGAS